MMAVVLLTENSSKPSATSHGGNYGFHRFLAYLCMRMAGSLGRMIGPGGASIISRVSGRILASIAATMF